jgi:hypothetical protein
MFTRSDLETLTDVVAEAWTAGADRDWSVQADTVEWTCTRTADHAVDCVFAPAFFLASRLTDRYPDAGDNFTVGADATPAQLVEALRIASRVLAAVVADTDRSVRAVIFRRPTVVTAPPPDFLPRGALELILHANDVCKGLGVAYEPPADLCERLIDHAAGFPWAGMGWTPPSIGTDDPWGELLRASGRAR